METDFAPGDPPLPVGTVVDYFGRGGAPGRYVVWGHADPADPYGNDVPDLSVFFPDGVGYEIWPEGMERRFGNKDWAVYNVRRPNLRVAGPGVPPQEGSVP